MAGWSSTLIRTEILHWTDCHKIWCRRSCPPQDDFGDPFTFHLAPSSGIFGLWPCTCEPNGIPIILCCTCVYCMLEFISKHRRAQVELHRAAVVGSFDGSGTKPIYYKLKMWHWFEMHILILADVSRLHKRNCMFGSTSASANPLHSLHTPRN